MTQVSGKPDDLDEISDEELSAWYEKLRRSAELASVEGGESLIPVWHGQSHVANPIPLSRVREELRRAGYTAMDMRQSVSGYNDGSNSHRLWHLFHPGETHG